MAKPTQHFGALLRDTRKAKGYTLRKFAEMADTSATYLSMIEQGKLDRPPAAERIRVMAELLGEDPDHWIALAGRMPSDVEEIIRKEPEAMPALLRAAKNMTADELRQWTEKMEKQRSKEKKT